jgi:hypothetical protein
MKENFQFVISHGDGKIYIFYYNINAMKTKITYCKYSVIEISLDHSVLVVVKTYHIPSQARTMNSSSSESLT